MLMQVFLWMIFFLSLGLIFLSSILMIGVYSLIISLFTCCVISMLFSSWFSIISVVVYVGGLLVMFSYFLAICPNQMGGVSVFVPVGLFTLFPLFLYFSEIFFFPTMGGVFSGVMIMYKSMNGGFLIFLGVFLLMTLVSVVKVVRLSQGPLRPFIN